MDRMLYIAMSGAKENMNSLAVRGNNLANANTTAFKADFEQARSMQAFGEGLPTRVFSITERPSQSFEAGALNLTGRDLDVAVEGSGWISVLDENGQPAMTRNGGLQITETGLLKTSSGQVVLGDADQPIIIPLPFEKLEINRDGTIEIMPEGAAPNGMEEIGRIKLVQPNTDDIEKGTDGLFRRKDGQDAEAAADVYLVKGALETSNVNVVSEMTNLITLQRQFEMQVKMMKTAEETDKSSASLLRMS